jgi:predicted transcriptional regulator
LTATNDRAFEDGEKSLVAEPGIMDLTKKIDAIVQNIEILMQNVSLRSESTSDELVEQAKPAARAIDLYGNRRRRVKLFGPDLFGEPAWDILLDLFIATETGKQISVTSACIGAAVPLTTALRWLSMLEARGLIVRESDDKDARRSYVRLSDMGRELMDQYLSAN